MNICAAEWRVDGLVANTVLPGAASTGIGVVLHHSEVNWNIDLVAKL